MTSSVQTQYLASAAATLGAFAYGMVLGWSSPAQLPIMSGDVYEFPLTAVDFQWASSIPTLGAALACIPAGFLVDLIGRKYTMLAMTIPFVVGWVFIIVPAAVEMLIVGRLITGFCGGLFCVASPIYIADISDTNIRGLLSSFYQLMVNLGILVSYVLGAFIPVMWLSIVCAIMPLVFTCCFFWMPETPQYLLMRGNQEQAEKSLQYFRGKNIDVKIELAKMKEEVDQQMTNKVSFIGIFRDKIAVKGLLIFFGVMFLQEMSGINAVLFFANDIFVQAGTSLEPRFNSIIIGAVQALATIPATLVVDKLGRKLLLTISAVSMAIFISILGFYFYFQEDLQEQGWLPLSTLVLYVISFSFGAGPVVWIIGAEIFALKVRGPASALGAAYSWSLAFLVTFFYADLVEQLHNYTTFWIFGGCCVLGALHVIFFLPETKGKTTEQILKELGAEDEIQ